MTDCTIAIAQGPSFKIQPSAMHCKLDFMEKQILKRNNFVKRSQRNLNSTRKFCLTRTINKNTLITAVT